MNPLYSHQRETIEFCKTRDCVFDASDPGTGKSRAAIEAFEERRLRSGGAILIICPKSSIRSTWAEEYKKYAPHVRVSCAYARNRREAFWKTADVYITNHDATVWLAKQPPTFYDNFSGLIIDEIGAYKHSTSQRSKALNKIKKYFRYRHGMNGTPDPNSVLELWNQMFIIDDGARLGTSFFKFRSTVCVPKQVGPAASMIKWEDREGANDAVAKLMSDITIRHVFEECIDIPPNHEYYVPYELTVSQYQHYKNMEAAQIAQIRGKNVTAINAATVATKLLQIASGAVYDEAGEYVLVDTERYSAVIDKAEERTNTIIFFLWKHQKTELIAEAERRGLSYCVIDGSVTDTQREENVEYYQRGMYRICFAHPKSAAHSLTLTRGVATIWASPTYNLEWYIQGLKRIYRATQTQKTETITFVAPGTIEEKVWAMLTTKKLRMDDLLEQLA